MIKKYLNRKDKVETIKTRVDDAINQSIVLRNKKSNIVSVKSSPVKN